MRLLSAPNLDRIAATRAIPLIITTLVLAMDPEKRTQQEAPLALEHDNALKLLRVWIV